MVWLLGASPDVAAVRRLSLLELYHPPHDLGAAARALGEGKHWKSLRSLELTIGGHLDMEGARALGRLKDLEELVLVDRHVEGGTALGTGVAAEFARAFPKLRVLSLMASTFRDDIAFAFAESTKLKHLQRLVVFGRCGITDPEACSGWWPLRNWPLSSNCSWKVRPSPAPSRHARSSRAGRRSVSWNWSAVG